MSSKPTRRSVVDPPAENASGANWGARQQLPNPISLLRDAEPERKKLRDRTWEKRHNGLTVRGVPTETRQAVKTVARDNGCSADAVARAFLEYALVCYERGDLVLEPVLSAGRRTLAASAVWEERKRNPTPPIKKRKAPTSSWKLMTHYRLPDELIERIKEICTKLTIRRGETVAYLLAHSLGAYNTGVLVLRAE